MAFKFENIISDILDSVSEGMTSAVEAVKDPEKAAELRRRREREAVPEITSYYMNADQEPIDINNKRGDQVGEASSSVVVPNDVEAMENDLRNSGYDPDKYINGEGASLLKPKFEAEDSAKNISGYKQEFENTSSNPLIQKELDERQARQQAYNESVVNSSFGQIGADVSSDPIYQQQVASARNAAYDPTAFSEELFRRGDDGTGMPNILGFTSQLKSSDNVKQAYEEGFEKYGNIEPTSKSADQESRQNLSDWEIVSEMPGYDENGQPLSENGERRVGKIKLDEIPVLNEIFSVQKNLIDDGRSEASREAMYMTGEQYLRYKHDFGIPGRPDRLIDPDELYSKQDEMEQYGFMPYIVSDEGLNQFHNNAASAKTSNLFNGIANARRNATDYTIAYDGEEYSGKDLSRNSNVWSKQNKREMEESKNADDPKWINDRSAASEFAVPFVSEYTITIDGQSTSRTGEPEWKFGEMDNQSGLIHLIWPDGQVWNFDDDQDFYNSLSANSRQAMSPEEEEQATSWYEATPLELDDGRKIRADKANVLVANVFGEDADQYADYGFANMGKPVANSPEEGVLPWFTDMLLGSSPLFFGPTAGAQGTAGMMNTYQGIKAGSDDYLNGTYSLLSDNVNEDTRNIAAAANAALPLTERLWGPIGGSVFKPLTKWGAGKFGKAKPYQRYLMGIGGEAAEEVPGNIVEEAMTGTGTSWYGNQLYRDENGELTTEATHKDKNGKDVKNVLAYDSQGTAIRDPNTPLDQRIMNLLYDAPDSMLGGGAFGATLGLLSIPKYRREYQKAMGNMKPGYSENVTVPIDLREKLYYDKGWSPDEKSYWDDYNEEDEDWYVSPEDRDKRDRQMWEQYLEEQAKLDEERDKAAENSLREQSELMNWVNTGNIFGFIEPSPEELEQAYRDLDREDYEKFMRENDEKSTKGPYYGRFFTDDKYKEEPVNPETGRMRDDEFDDYLADLDDKYIYKKIIDAFANRYEHDPEFLEMPDEEYKALIDDIEYQKALEDAWNDYKYGDTDTGYWRGASRRLGNLYDSADFENHNDLRDIAEEYAVSGDVYDWLLSDMKNPEKAKSRPLGEIKDLADTYEEWKPRHEAMKKIVQKALKNNFLI